MDLAFPIFVFHVRIISYPPRKFDGRKEVHQEISDDEEKKAFVRAKTLNRCQDKSLLVRTTAFTTKTSPPSLRWRRHKVKEVE